MSAAEAPTLADLRGAVRRALLLRQAENSRGRDGLRRMMREDVPAIAHGGCPAWRLRMPVDEETSR